jgi:hypothetical protein
MSTGDPTLDTDRDQQATVMWIPLPHDGAFGVGSTRKFDDVPAAIRFIMERLPPEERRTAWIRPVDGSEPLKIDVIEKLYPQLPAQSG